MADKRDLQNKRYEFVELRIDIKDKGKRKKSIKTGGFTKNPHTREVMNKETVLVGPRNVYLTRGMDGAMVWLVWLRCEKAKKSTETIFFGCFRPPCTYVYRAAQISSMVSNLEEEKKEKSMRQSVSDVK